MFRSSIVNKTCSTCHQVKAVSEFSPDNRKKGPDKLQARCKGCNAERTREWIRANKEVQYAKHREWCSTEHGKAWRSAYNRAYREANRERLAEDAARWVRENRERHNEHGRRWYKNNSEKAAQLRRANRKGRALGPEALEYAEIIMRDPCTYCGRRGGEVDHIEPIVNGGDNTWANLTGACRKCNGRKSAQPLLQFLARDGLRV